MNKFVHDARTTPKEDEGLKLHTEGEAVRELLAAVTEQDIEKQPSGPVTLKNQVAIDRVICSIGRCEMRDTRKRRYDGYRTHFVEGPLSDSISEVAVTSANHTDADLLSDMPDQNKAGIMINSVIGGSPNSSGDVQAEMFDSKVESLTPMSSRVRKSWPRCAVRRNSEDRILACPVGHVSRQFPRCIISILTLALFYPRPLFTISDRYHVFLSYPIWVLAFFCITQSIHGQGHKNRVSAILWVLRGYVVLDFLILTLSRSSLRAIDFYSVAGVLFPTFMYEAGVLISRLGMFSSTLRSICFCATLWSLQPAIKASAFLIEGGPAAVLYGMSQLRLADPAWPNGVGMLMAVIFLVELEISRQSFWHRLVKYVALSILVITLSRTAMVMLVIGVTARQILLGKKFSTAMVLLLACGLAFSVFQAKSVLQQDSLENTSMGRLGRWEVALSIWKENPLFGQGFQSFDETAGSYWHARTNTSIRVGSSHNDFVDLLVRGGLVYCLLFVLMVIRWGRLTYSRRHLTHIRLCLLTVVLILFGSLAQNPLKYGPLVSLYWLVIGAGTYLSETSDSGASYSSILVDPLQIRRLRKLS